jgi:hypothetical protein
MLNLLPARVRSRVTTAHASFVLVRGRKERCGSEPRNASQVLRSGLRRNGNVKCEMGGTTRQNCHAGREAVQLAGSDNVPVLIKLLKDLGNLDSGDMWTDGARTYKMCAVHKSSGAGAWGSEML